MPIIDISMLEGRPKEKKAELIRNVTDTVVETLGVPAQSVRVIIRDVPADQWGVAGVPKSQS